MAFQEVESLRLPTLDHTKRAATIRSGYDRLNRLGRQSRVNQLSNRSRIIRDALRDRWRAAQAFVRPAQIVVRDVQRHGCSMVVEFL